MTSSTSIIAWKRPVSQRRPRSRNAGDEILVQLTGALGTSGRIEGWPLAATHVAEKRELRDRQDRPAYVLDAEVHLSRVVLKDSQPRNFLRQIIRVSFGVLLRHSQQHQQTEADLARECRRRLSPMRG